MKKTIILFLLLFAMSMLMASELEWVYRIEDAVKEAKGTDKLILVNFTGSDWCVWCHRIRDEIFSTKVFQDFAKENLVLVELDFPKNKQLSQDDIDYNRKQLNMYGVQGFPTILFLNSDGLLIDRTGYQQGGGDNYVKYIKDLREK